MQEAQQRLLEAQRLAQLESWELDLVSGELTWSDEVFRIFEIDGEKFEASYEAFLAAVHPDDRAMVDSAYTASLKNRAPYTITHRLRMPDGRVKWVYERCESTFDDDGNPLVSLGTVQDVTERVNADAALEASQARLTEILDIAPGAIITVDADMKIQIFNQAAENIFGYRSEEMLGQPMDLLIPEELRQGHARLVADFKTSPKTFLTMDERQEISALRRDGSEFPATASVSKLVIDGEMLFTVMLQDISERRAAEAKLIQADKLATLGTLAAGTAHELGQPLNIIRLTTDMMLYDREENPPEDSTETEDLELILAQVQRMADIVEHMSIFSRKQDKSDELFRPGEAVASAAKMVNKQFLAVDIQVETEIPDFSCMVRGTPGRLEQVVLNLLSNAQDAIEARSRELAGSEQRFRGRIGVRLIEDAVLDQILISVSDNGGGIEPGALRNIFDPFFTTKDVGKGTGLGLHVSHSIIEAMGGDLEVENTSVGARFTISLPRVQDVAAAS